MLSFLQEEKAYFFCCRIYFNRRNYYFETHISSDKLRFSNLKGVNHRMDMPIWILIVFGGIIVSAIMAMRAARQERVIENTWIEEEGQKYLERMRLEQERRESTGDKEYDFIEK